MAHLRKYIGVYLLGMVALARYFDTPDDDYPLWLWWLIVPVILWKVPPFSVGDRFWGYVMRLYEWLFQIPMRWLKKAPRWFQIVFAIVMIIVFEEYLLAPLGYTMYPWRMDLG